jgi:hypothetical protein
MQDVMRQRPFLVGSRFDAARQFAAGCGFQHSGPPCQTFPRVARPVTVPRSSDQWAGPERQRLRSPMTGWKATAQRTRRQERRRGLPSVRRTPHRSKASEAAGRLDQRTGGRRRWGDRVPNKQCTSVGRERR